MRQGLPSLKDLCLTPSSMDGPGGYAREVGVVRVMLGVNVDAYFSMVAW